MSTYFFTIAGRQYVNPTMAGLQSTIREGAVALRDPLTRRQEERNAGTATSGHAEGAAGLRGHSIDADTYPWRVVFAYHRKTGSDKLIGYWEVHGADGVMVNRQPDTDIGCKVAHAVARKFKVMAPSGRLGHQ